MSRMSRVGVALMLVGFGALLVDSGLLPERRSTAPSSFSEVPPATLALPLNSGWGSFSAAHIPSVASAAYGLYIYSIDPNVGTLLGGTPVVIAGNFPVPTPITTVAAAEAAYTVYFDYVIQATFDSSVPQMVTATAMYVISPPGIVLGPGDVLLLDDADSNNFAIVEDGYRYFDQIVLTSVAPVFGPLAGAQMVTLTGTFPVVAAVATAAEAYSQFIVYFSYGNRAPFDELVPPVITDWIPPADNIMLVLSPPGGMPGFVDVIVYAANDPTNFDSLLLEYEYEAGVGEWSGVEIVTKDRSSTIRANDPVGRLDARELEVRLTVDGTINDAYIIPQGGNPALQAHRIQLEFSASYTNALLAFDPMDTRQVWTNVLAIERIVLDIGAPGESSGDLFADGHATVVIVDSSMVILGDEPLNLTEGGRITGDAFTDRHFLIDTTPPTMFVSVAGDQADLFVLQLSNLNIPGYKTIAANIGPGAFHPFPLPGGGFPQETDDAPIDLGTITDVPGTSNGAQIFMNVASLANDFVGEDLRIQVDVRFVDLSVHDTFGIGLAPIDIDLYAPFTITRQVSGFDTRPSPDGSFPGSLLNLPNVDFPEVTVRARLLGGDHVQWVYAAGSDKLSPTGAATVTTDHTVVVAVDSGYFSDTNTTLDTQWKVTGIPRNPQKLHLALQFRAHDWAGSWTNADSDPRTDFTDADRRLDPLHIWWLRNTATRLFPNREGSEVFDPTFTLNLDNGFSTNANGLPPIYTFRLWQSVDQGKGGYDSNYTPVTGWRSVPGGPVWDAQSAMATGLIGGIAVPNFWYLLTVFNTDEAGNVENWDNTSIFLDDNLTPANFADDLVTNFPSGSGRNWQRFFIKAEEQEVETELTAFFWHNDNSPWNVAVDVGELVFGETHIIPLPPKSAFDPNDPLSPVQTERVEARFVIRAVTDIADPDIIWELWSEGTPIAGPTEIPNPVNGIATLVLPLNGGGFPFLGDPDRRRAIPYVFRAFTYVDQNANNIHDAGEPIDSTPANFHFTVVPSVQGFIENRQSDEEQPIKVFERQ